MTGGKLQIHTTKLSTLQPTNVLAYCSMCANVLDVIVMLVT